MGLLGPLELEPLEPQPLLETFKEGEDRKHPLEDFEEEDITALGLEDEDPHKVDSSDENPSSESC